MIAADLIGQVRDAGGQITADGADLVLTAPGPLPGDLLDKLRVHKAAILAALTADLDPAASYDDPAQSSADAAYQRRAAAEPGYDPGVEARYCCECANRAADQRCLAWERIGAPEGFRPADRRPRRCRGFTPGRDGGELGPLAAPAPIARLPQAPVNLEEAIRAACEGVAGISPAQFRALLSPEDLDDVAAGAIHPKTLAAYAQSFAEGLRSGRIAPVEDPMPVISGELIRRGCKGLLDDISIELRLAGLELVKDGDNLVVEPKEASTPEWNSLIDAHKAELLAEWAALPR